LNHERYSKTWHRQHGGVWEVSERRVDMQRRGPLGSMEVVRSIQVPGFRGHWLVRAIASLLELPTPRVPAALRSVQGVDVFSVDPLPNIDGAEMYRRSLGPIEVDFCAVRGGVTFHAATPRSAVDGLARKAQSRARTDKPADLISVRTGLKLGFCMAGIRDFCDVNEIDVEASFTRKDLREIVSQRREENECRWGAELRELDLL
jgi:hypothetical protein